MRLIIIIIINLRTILEKEEISQGQVKEVLVIKDNVKDNEVLALEIRDSTEGIRLDREKEKEMAKLNSDPRSPRRKDAKAKIIVRTIIPQLINIDHDIVGTCRLILEISNGEIVQFLDVKITIAQLWNLEIRNGPLGVYVRNFMRIKNQEPTMLELIRILDKVAKRRKTL